MKCDGYSDVTTWPKKQSLKDTYGVVGSSLIITNPWTAITKSSREMRSLQHFFERTITQFSGPFATPFWTTELLRTAYYDDGIRHAVIALSSYHEAFERRQSTRPLSNGSWQTGIREDYGMHHYNSAIQKILRPSAEDGPPARGIYLVSCAMFFFIETLRGSHPVAIDLWKHGTNILCEWKNSILSDDEMSEAVEKSATPFASPDTVEAFFIGLSHQITQLIGDDTMVTRACMHCRLEPAGLRAPEYPSFTTLAGARDILDFGMSYWMHLSDHVLGEEVDTKTREHYKLLYMELFQQWSMTLDLFIQEHSPKFTAADKQAAAILRLRRALVLTAMIHGVDDRTDPLRWDSYTDAFEQAIEEAKITLAIDKATEGHRSVFSPDAAVVPGLFGLAHRCRDPRVRRSVIDLLRSSSRQEGLWDAVTVANVIEEMVRLEEDGLGVVETAGDIPAENRISAVRVTYHDQEQLATVEYYRGSQGDPTADMVHRKQFAW